MIRELSDLADKVDHDTIGRVIAYGGGGTGIAVTKLSEIAQNSAVYDWGYWMFGAAIFGRLVFDVYKYFKSGK